MFLYSWDMYIWGMLFSFQNVVQKIRQIARRAVCSAAAVAAMEKKRRDSVFTKEEEIFIIKQFEPEEWLQSFKIKNEMNFTLLFSFLWWVEFDGGRQSDDIYSAIALQFKMTYAMVMFEGRIL